MTFGASSFFVGSAHFHIRIALAAEIDCCKEPAEGQDPSLNDYVELKTSRIVDSPKTAHSFKRYKLLKFWIQSFLAGVPRVVCGFRDDNGIVRDVKELQTQAIPSQAEGKWDPWDCLNFAHELLRWVSSLLSKELNDEEGQEYLLSFSKPFQDVVLVKR